MARYKFDHQEEKNINACLNDEGIKINCSSGEEKLSNNVDVHIYNNPLKSLKNLIIVLLLVQTVFAYASTIYLLRRVSNEVDMLQSALIGLSSRTSNAEISLVKDLMKLKRSCAEVAQTRRQCYETIADEGNENDAEELLRDKRDVLAFEQKSVNKKNNSNNAFNNIKSRLALMKWKKKLKVFCLKQRKKFENQFSKENNRTKEVSAIQLRGGIPEITMQDKVVTGTIGPWFYQKGDTNNIPSLKLEDSSVEIIEDGVYLLYAQVYYLSSSGSNSYSLVKTRRNTVDEETLATCSEGDGAKGEVSCFTATVRSLAAGDKLYLREREKQRRVLFRDGQTYFGLVLLSAS